MGFLVSEGLFDGGFTMENASSFGWISRAKVTQVMTMIENHGAGLSCGISLRGNVSPVASLKG